MQSCCCVFNLLYHKVNLILFSSDLERRKIPNLLFVIQKIVLSGCIHITAASILLALFSSDLEMTSKKRIMHAFTEADSGRMNNNVRLEKPLRLFTFSNVREVDISKCPKLHIVATIKCLALAFPSLSILRASHCSQFKNEDLYFLIQNIPKLTEADISVDVSPLLPAKVYVVSTNIEEYRVSNTSSYAMLEDKSLFSVARPTLENPIMSNISKLTLEGRRDITGKTAASFCQIS